MKVARIRHGAIACLLPHDQVLEGARRPDEPPITLWDPRPGTAETRFVRVRVAQGTAWLACSEIEVIDGPPPRPLPPALAAVMALPHVVGWTEIDGELVWLVDLRRYAADTGM